MVFKVEAMISVELCQEVGQVSGIEDLRRSVWGCYIQCNISPKNGASKLCQAGGSFSFSASFVLP